MPEARTDGGKHVRTDRYDFDRLERSVGFLLEEHERLSAEHAGLREELVDRERRIAALERQLEAERARCAAAAEGIGKILTRVDQLQASAARAAGSA